MSRKGHYHGGGTKIGRENTSWYSKDRLEHPKTILLLGQNVRLPNGPHMNSSKNLGKAQAY